MKQTKLIMGMPITVEIIGGGRDDLQAVFDYFTSIDGRYSTYKEDSEISRINCGLPQREWSAEMRRVLALCEETKRLTGGYFDIKRSDGTLDPSGLVKGWAINIAAALLQTRGRNDFYIEAGGDVQVHGKAGRDTSWRAGIRNPFVTTEIIKIVQLVADEGLATSGTYIRGQHIYDPHAYAEPVKEPVSLSVIGPNIYEADRFATAAFAMGRRGISFIEQMPGLEGYMVDSHAVATMTSGFERYVV